MFRLARTVCKTKSSTQSIQITKNWQPLSWIDHSSQRSFFHVYPVLNSSAAPAKNNGNEDTKPTPFVAEESKPIQQQENEQANENTTSERPSSTSATKLSYRFKDPVTADFYKKAEASMAQREQYIDKDDPENKPFPDWVSKVYARFALIAFLFFATGIIGNYLGFFGGREQTVGQEEKLKGAMLRRAVALDRESNDLLEEVKKERDQVLSKLKLKDAEDKQ